MLKKYILLFACSLSFLFGSICFGDTGLDIKINYIEISNGEINVYGDNFDQFSNFGGYLGGSGLEFSLKNDAQGFLKFLVPKETNYNKVDLYVVGKKFELVKDSYEEKEYKSNTIKIGYDLPIYISNIIREFKGDFYDIIISLKNRPANQKISVYLNDELVPDADIVDEINNIKVKYKKAQDNHRVHIKVVAGDFVLNSNDVSLDNVLDEITLQSVDKNSDFVYATIKTKGGPDQKIFVDKAQVTKDYEIRGENVKLIFPITDTKYKKMVYVTDSYKKSNKLLIDLSKYLVPKITEFRFLSDTTVGKENSIYGKNFDTSMAYTKIIIDSKEYPLEKSINMLDSNIIYGFEKIGDKLVFKQPIEYDGTNHTIQVKINDRLSNIVAFSGGVSPNILEEIEPVSTIHARFKGAIAVSGTIKDGNLPDIQLGSLELFSGNKNDYHIQEVKFQIIIDSIANYLPIDYIKLGDKNGLIEKINDTKYNVTFFDIEALDLVSMTQNLSLKLSYNTKDINFKVQPLSVSYKFLDAKNNKDTVNQLTISHDGEMHVKTKYHFSPCFDTTDNYTNCITLGYPTQTSIIYSTSKDTPVDIVVDTGNNNNDNYDTPQVDTNTNNDGVYNNTPVDTNNNDYFNNDTPVDNGNNNFDYYGQPEYVQPIIQPKPPVLSKSKKLIIRKIAKKLDKIATKMAKGSKKKKKAIYKQIHSMIIKMKNKSKGKKRLTLRYLGLVIKKQYKRIK